MTLTFPGESAEYRAARDRLLEREIELRREMEAVAAARRELPPGGVVPEDYVFQGKAADGQSRRRALCHSGLCPGRPRLRVAASLAIKAQTPARAWAKPERRSAPAV